MAYAQLSQERIDRTDLHTVSAAMISQRRRADMIVAIRNQKGDRRKPLQNLVAVFWPQETLKQFLKYKTRRQQSLAGFNGLDECRDLPGRDGPVAPQSERPYARVYKDRQSRARPAL